VWWGVCSTAIGGRLDVMVGADGSADPGVGPGWRWDVALSFASARREYVEHVRASALRAIARWWHDDEVLAFLRARGADDPDPIPQEAIRKVLMPYRREGIRVDGKMPPGKC
jgi:hypothetical protein